MIFYTRPQLAVLLLVVLTAGIGLGVGQWRRTHSALAERLERFDRTAAPTDVPAGASAPAGRDSGPRRSTQAGGPPPARRAAPPKHSPPPRAVDINRATEDELRSLPGIGSALATRIIEARERHGPFVSVDDLRRVRGLGRSKLERLTTSLAVGP